MDEIIEFSLSEEGITIGDYNIYSSNDGYIWIEHNASDREVTISRSAFRNLIHDFFEESF